MSVPNGTAMYELTFWPDGDDTVLTASIGGDSVGAGALYEAKVDVHAAKLQLLVDGAVVGTHDIQSTGKPEGGIVPASWNMLRLLVTDDSVCLWFNPQFSDVTGGSVPAEETSMLVPMPPRLHAAVSAVDRHAAEQPGAMKLLVKSGKTGKGFRIDYASILPPTLYGLAVEAATSVLES